MRKRWHTPGSIAGFMLITLALSGCSGKDLKTLLPDGLTAPTPGEMARQMFNLYDPDKRREAVNRLSAAPYGGKDPYLKGYRLLIDDPDPTVRAACATALGLHGDVEDADRLILRLQDEATFVRWEVAKALQKIHNERAIKPLTESLKNDPDPDVRMASATALGQYTDRGVFNVLIGALEDPHYSVVIAAHRSLKTQTGQDFPPDGQPWLQWARENKTTIFANKDQYTWKPYQKGQTWWDKVQVWKKPPPPVQPKIPTGAAGSTGKMQLPDGSG